MLRKTVRKIDDLQEVDPRNPLRVLNLNRFGGLNLEGADLRNADLSVDALKTKHKYPENAETTGVNLAHANLRYADLTDADLTGARLGGADLTGADLTGTILIGVDDLSTAINADTTNAILTYQDLLARRSTEQKMGGKNRKIRNKTRKTYKKRKNKKRKMLNKKRRLKTRKMK